MNLFADSNIERQLIAALRADGHDVLSASELGADPGDDILLAKATSASRTVVTGDLDFGELVVRDCEMNSGVILLRLDPLTLSTRIRRVCDVLKSVGQPPSDVLIVIEPGKMRTRKTLEEK